MFYSIINNRKNVFSFSYALNLCVAMLVAAVVSLNTSSPAIAQADTEQSIDLTNLNFEAETQGRTSVSLLRVRPFGRMLVNFNNTPIVESDDLGGVIRLSVSEPLPVNELNQVISALAKYIVAVKADEESKVFRLAVAPGVKIITQVADKDLYIDLLPPLWSGPPPGLPVEVVQNIVARAAKAEEDRKEAERLLRLGREKFRIKPVPVRFPTFSRIYFRWTWPVPVAVHRDGTLVRLVFDSVSEAKMEFPAGSLGGDIVSFRSRNLEGQKTVVDLRVKEETDIRTFQASEGYVLDLVSDIGALAEERAIQDIIGEGGLGEGSGVTRISPVLKPRNDNIPRPRINNYKNEQPSDNNSNKSSKDLLSNLFIDDFSVANSQSTINQQSQDAKISDAVAEAIKNRPYIVARSDTEQNTENLPAVFLPKGSGAKFVTGSLSGNKSPFVKEPLEVITSSLPNSGEIILPFEEQVAAAIFQRGLNLWIVADTKRDLVVPPVGSNNSIWEMIDTIRSDSRKIVKVRMREEFPIFAYADGNSWVVKIGKQSNLPAYAEARIDRVFSGANAPYIKVESDHTGTSGWHKDNEFNDEIMVITALPPSKVINPGFRLVDVDIFKSWAGVAISPFSDSVKVDFLENELVVFDNNGLNISLPDTQTLRKNSGVNAIENPLIISINKTPEKIRGNFYEKVREFEHEIINANYPERAEIEVKLSRMMIEYGLAEEAMGSLALAIEGMPEIAVSSEVIGLLGVANLMGRRYKVAAKYFDSRHLDENVYASVWRGIAAAKIKNWKAASAFLEKGEPFVRYFDNHIQIMYRLAAAETALELNQLWLAQQQLNSFPEQASQEELDQKQLLFAQYSLAAGKLNDALKTYDRTSWSPHLPTAVRAAYEAIKVRYDQGQLSNEEAIDGLSQLILTWRGDEYEVFMSSYLTRLLATDGKYRAAFANGTLIARNFPDNAEIRNTYNFLSELYRELFLYDKANELDPLEALSLFYDYSEMIPPGEEGDAMARKMADRLLSVDLLKQAIEVLEHQVEQRLRGYRRAEVAAKLAMIYLLNRQAERAVIAITRTRQAELPKVLENFRHIIESKALSELGQYERAISLLQGINSERGLRLRAQIYWTKGNWREAAKMYADLAAMKKNEEIDEKARLDLARSTVAYALIGDNKAIAKLYKKYADINTDGGIKQIFSAFSKIKSVDDPSFVDFNSKLSEIEKLDSFLGRMLKEYDEAFPNVIFES